MSTFDPAQFNWEDVGDLGAPKRSRLSADLKMGETTFWVEAVAVKDADDGEQLAFSEEGQSRLNGLCAEYDSPGFQTVDIGGQAYVIFITPYGR